ncbi:CHAT domain-containing protein [Streptomyces sp. 6N223]|uniref:CHAT domain-containing protein n=1 Tax=Streptomyces sp. 6N223 TaxID=3457412 RepID=UPI003FD65107
MDEESTGLLTAHRGLLAEVWPCLRDGRPLPEPSEEEARGLRRLAALGAPALQRGKRPGFVADEHVIALLAGAYVFPRDPRAPAALRAWYAPPAEPDQVLADRQRRLAGALSSRAETLRAEGSPLSLLCRDASLLATRAVSFSIPPTDSGYQAAPFWQMNESAARFELTSDDRDMLATVRYAHRFLDLAASDPTEQAQRAHEVAGRVALPIGSGRNPSLIQELTGLLREILPLVDADSAAEFAVRLTLADVLIDAVLRGGEPRERQSASLAEAARLVEEVPQRWLYDRRHPETTLLYAKMLSSLHRLNHEPEALDKAIDAYRFLFETTPATDPVRAHYAARLVDRLLFRHRIVRRDEHDVSEVLTLLDVLDEAAAETGAPDVLVALADVAEHGYQLGQDAALLELAVERLEHATAPGAQHAHDAPLLRRLADLFTRGYDAIKDADRRGESTARRAVEVSRQSGERADCLGGLGSLLIRRYEATQQLAVLEEAIDVGREALLIQPDDPWRPPREEMFLLSALLRRYSRTGDTASLDEALTLAERMMTGRSELTAEFPTVLGVVAGVLTLGAQGRERLRRMELLLRGTLARMPSRHPSRGLLRINLAELRMHQNEDGALDEAVGMLEVLADSGEVTGEELTSTRLSLAEACHWRFLRDTAQERSGGTATADRADLDRAVDIARAEAAAAPLGSYARRKALGLLQEMLVTSIGLDEGDGPDILRATAEIIPALTELVEDTSASALQRIEYAVTLAGFARPFNRPQALATARTAVELLPLVAWRGADRVDHENQLAAIDGLPVQPGSFAAEIALEAGRTDDALELLEQGRGVLATQALQLRTGMDRLARSEPGIAARLGALRQALDESFVLRDSADTDRRHRLAREWEETLAQARAVPGFENLLRPARARELVHAGDEGPVVMVNAGAYHCDALLLEGGRVRPCPLPDLNLAEAKERMEAFLEAATVGAARPSGMAGALAQRIAAETLDWLWNAVAAPVLTKLGVTSSGSPDDVTPLPRLWWCPTGPLNFLPLHAATDSRTGDSVLDRVVSSYTPSVGALLRARRSGAQRGGGDGPRMLVVSAGDVPGYPPLPAVRREAALLGGMPGWPTTTQLADDRATAGRVCREIAGHSWVHFACHGAQDPASPSRGALVLPGGELGVLDLARLDLAHGEVAYLSACDTALGGIRMPEEAVHLAGSLQLAGFRQVVGTLWRVADDTAAEVAERVYGRLGIHRGHPVRAEPPPVALALHEAVRAVRKGASDRPLDWAAYVHTGR